MLEQEKKVGECAVLGVEGRGFVYYLITKERYFQKPTYDSFKSALQDMKNHMVKYKMTALDIPKLGCGLDKLNWSKV